MKVLIVSNMQNGFLKTQNARSIVFDVNERITECMKDGYEVCFLRYGNDRDFVMGTRSWEITDAIDTSAWNFINTKSKFSYPAENWKERLGTEVESIEICGLFLDTSILANAVILKFAYPDIPVMVNLDLCADFNTARHEASIESMKKEDILCLKGVTNE